MVISWLLNFDIKLGLCSVCNSSSLFSFIVKVVAQIDDRLPEDTKQFHHFSTNKNNFKALMLLVFLNYTSDQNKYILKFPYRKNKQPLINAGQANISFFFILTNSLVSFGRWFSRSVCLSEYYDCRPVNQCL